MISLGVNLLKSIIMKSQIRHSNWHCLGLGGFHYSCNHYSRNWILSRGSQKTLFWILQHLHLVPLSKISINCSDEVTLFSNNSSPWNCLDDCWEKCVFGEMTMATWFIFPDVIIAWKYIMGAALRKNPGFGKVSNAFMNMRSRISAGQVGMKKCYFKFWKNKINHLKQNVYFLKHLFLSVNLESFSDQNSWRGKVWIT